MLKITDDLIEDFLKGRCTKEEAAIVWKYLQEHPDNGYLLDEYKGTDGETALPEGYREEMLRAITERTERRPAGKHYLAAPLRWAAAIVLLACSGWFLVKILNHPVRDALPGMAGEQETAAIIWITKNNAGKGKIPMVLPDSSRVILYPGSYIQYRSDFGQYNKREIRINGEAFFVAARNKQKPFIVYCDRVSTTALGTSFKVIADSVRERIQVQLFTGKVLVSLNGWENKSVTSQKSLGNYYLSPGQELIFDKLNGRISVRGIKISHTGSAQSFGYKTMGLSNWYMFNNQNLGVVFDQLSAIYNVGIQYSEEETNHIYFIGKLDRTDSLDKILRDIAFLNHLSVTTRNGMYIIGKGV
jgi:transmembrane sensor